jgi:hypothetical protein
MLRVTNVRKENIALLAAASLQVSGREEERNFIVHRQYGEHIPPS